MNWLLRRQKWKPFKQAHTNGRKKTLMREYLMKNY